MSMLPKPFYSWSTYEGHGGIDYGQPRNAAVRASGPGVIDFDGYYSDRGGYAKFIQYDCGCRHGYYHFDNKWGLTVGDRVEYGTIFARVGGLGQYSTGPHLHHEVWSGTSSIIKPPSYWNYVDKNSFVDPNAVALGGSSTPFPTDGAEMNAEEWRQFQVLAGKVNDIGVAVANINAWISEGGPGVNLGKADPGTIAGRLINVDRQVTGANGFTPSVASRVINIESAVNDPKA